MKVTIWGCRGSIARSHPSLQKYGGNTPCVEVEVEVEVVGSDNERERKGEEDTSTTTTTSTTQRVVLDMGSGAYELGQKLVQLGPLENQHIFLTHCHWDHIQGFPFFAPLYLPGASWQIHAPGGFATGLKQKLASQMSYEFFPLSIDMLGADLQYQDLQEGCLYIDNIRVDCQYLNHSVLTLGYKLTCRQTGATVAYITDHEPYNTNYGFHGYNPSDTHNNLQNGRSGLSTSTTSNSNNGDDRHVAFLKDVDLLIHDAQYLACEYEGKVSWGHATVEYVVDVALAANVGRLVLFHHDPQRTDDQLDDMLELARERVSDNNNSTMEVIMAMDRLELTVEPRSGASKLSKQSVITRNAHHASSRSAVVDKQPKMVPENAVVYIHHPDQELFSVLKEDNIKTTFLEDPTAEVNQLMENSGADNRPALFVFSCCNENDLDKIKDMCRRIRLDTDQDWASDIPILVIAKSNELSERLLQEPQHQAGITDILMEPMIAAYIRTRIRMALSRSPCRWIPPKLPANEAKRLAALRLLKLSSTAETRFDMIVKLARDALEVPVAALNLIDDSLQYNKSMACPASIGKMFPNGLLPPTPRDVSFCGHAILKKDLMIVQDTLQDPRFADNPQVASGFKMRFYAGCPIAIPTPNASPRRRSFSTYNRPRRHNSHGEKEETNMDQEGLEEYNVATLCIVDFKPRKFDTHHQNLLKQFSALVKRELQATLPPSNGSNGQRHSRKPSITTVAIDC